MSIEDKLQREINKHSQTKQDLRDVGERLNMAEKTIDALRRRVFYAETEWAAFRALVENAKVIIERDYPLGTEHSPTRIRHFLQRCEDALKKPPLE